MHLLFYLCPILREYKSASAETNSLENHTPSHLRWPCTYTPGITPAPHSRFHTWNPHLPPTLVSRLPWLPLKDFLTSDCSSLCTPRSKLLKHRQHPPPFPSVLYKAMTYGDHNTRRRLDTGEKEGGRDALGRAGSSALVRSWPWPPYFPIALWTLDQESRLW